MNISDIPYKQELYSSCPDRIKQAEYSVLLLFFQATRKGATIEEIRNYLLSKNIKSDLVEELIAVIKLHKEDFKQKAVKFAPAYLSYVNDVSWSLQCDVGSSSMSKPGEISYKIQLESSTTNVDGDKEVVAEFVCSPEELQSLINQLKEIERSCRKVATNKV